MLRPAKLLQHLALCLFLSCLIHASAVSMLRARFADFGGEFNFRNTITDRDTCTLSLGVTSKFHDTLSVGLAAGTDLGGLRSAGWGSLNLGWTF